MNKNQLIMRNQFFYTLEQNGKVYNFSFNPDYVIRTAEYQPGMLVVLLDDFHEGFVDKNVPVGKNGHTKMTRTKETINSEIFLNVADSARFMREFGISYPEIQEVNMGENEEPVAEKEVAE